MKQKLSILLFFSLFWIVSCDKPVVEKPENLIKEDKMVEMLKDIHLAEATFSNRRYQDTLLSKSSSANFYYSVLDKYQVSDSVFEQSFIYYASQPKKFEKMYRQVMNKLNEMEQEFSGRSNDILELEQENR
jgi:hypothetical protein